MSGLFVRIALISSVLSAAPLLHAQQSLMAINYADSNTVDPQPVKKVSAPAKAAQLDAGDEEDDEWEEVVVRRKKKSSAS